MSPLLDLSLLRRAPTRWQFRTRHFTRTRAFWSGVTLGFALATALYVFCH